MLTGMALAVGLGLAPSLVAGIPTRCDLARIASRNAVLNKYDQLVSELDRRISEAKANGKDPADSHIVAATGETRSVNIVSLTAELQNQKPTDLVRADRQVSKDCANDSNAVDNAKRTAESVTALGINAILSKHGISDTALFRFLPPS
jgi:hypothetical protein